MKKISLSAILATFFVFLNLQAQTITWNFDNNNLVGTSSDPAITVYNAKLGSGVFTSGFPDDGCSNGNPWSVRGWYFTPIANQSEAQAIANNDYVEFGIFIPAGYHFTPLNIGFESNRSVNAANTDFGPLNWSVRTSYDSYGAPIASGTNPNGASGSGAACQLNTMNPSMDIYGPQDFFIRIYAWGEVPDNIVTMRFDDVSIFGVLPVELLDFTLQRAGAEIQLLWETAAESGTVLFQIERALDGQVFELLEELPAHGTGKYVYVDLNPAPGQVAYRLKILDSDGSFKYGPIRSIDVDFWGKYPITLNPAQSLIRIMGPEKLQADLYWEVRNMAGQVLLSGAYTDGGIDVSNLAAGLYFCTIQDKNEVFNSIFMKD